MHFYFLTFELLRPRSLRTSYNNISWGCPGMLKSRIGMDAVSKRWESIVSLFKGYIALVPETLKVWLPATYSNGCVSNISLFSCLYWYAAFNSCKYLKSKTHLRNAQVNKASSVNKGIVKSCLIVDIVRRNWS